MDQKEVVRSSNHAKDPSKEPSTTQTSNLHFDRKHIDFLFIRLGSIYGHLWNSRHQSDQAWEITKDEWASALSGVKNETIKKVLEDLRASSDEYPPTLPKFLKLCRYHNGFPSEDEAFQQALRRDFTHPIAAKCYELIGSWAFTHDSEKSLRKKFNECYRQIENRYGAYVEVEAPRLIESNETVTASSSSAEIHPNRQRLINMSETEASSLPLSERYDRIRYLREIEAHEYLKRINPKLFEQASDPPGINNKKDNKPFSVKTYHKDWKR